MLRAAIIILACLSCGAVHAADIRYSTDYRLTLAGLTVAKASFVTEVSSNNYTISGSFKAAGIVDVFTDITAETSVSGQLAKSRMQARRYSLLYKSGRSERSYDVRFLNGNVTETIVDPKPGKRPDTWIAVSDADLKAVFDPITGLVVPQDEAVCSRTLPIYDGESRMDLVLSPKGSKTAKLAGVETEVTICGIRYIPKSGYRRGRDDIDYMSRATGMEIWFAKTDTLKVYAPVYARVPTRLGPLHITAVKFGG